jgi:hypothetical protein
MTDTTAVLHPIVRLANNHAGSFTQEFLEWLPDNLHVWRAFEIEAVRVHVRGFTHYSSRTILHVLRHHSATAEAESEKGWKLNNNHSPYLARLFDLAHPLRAGMWEYRTVKASGAAVEVA